MNDNKSNENEITGMHILKKIIATIRAESQELTDAVMGSYGTRKIELEYESAQSKLKEAKLALTEMMRKERQSTHIFDIIVEKISQKELLIDEALSHNNEQEAMKLAFEVVDLELNRDFQAESISSIAKNIAYLQGQLEQSERELKEINRQLTMLNTTENVRKATATIMGNIDEADASLLSAKKSLDRIRSKQKGKVGSSPLNKQLIKGFGSESSVQKSSSCESEVSKNSALDVIKRIQDKR